MTDSSPRFPAARLAVVDAIRRGHHTINALSAALGVTDNAVRVHLAVLQRDRLVSRRGTRHTGEPGQPAAEFELTPQGEVALSTAYPAALTALVAALGARLEPRARRAVYTEAGRRLAAGAQPPGDASLAQRAEVCAALVTALGGSATVEEDRGQLSIRGAGCPLSAAVRADPSACTIVESLLEQQAGVTARQHCDHGAHPSCRFTLTR
jgi:predicted ArsR family transcriptional regulator